MSERRRDEVAGETSLGADGRNPIGYNNSPSLGPAGLSIEGATYTNPNSSARTYVVNLVP